MARRYRAGWELQRMGHGRGGRGAGGALAVDGSVAFTTPFFDPPRTLEFAATFEPVNDQAVGLGQRLHRLSRRCLHHRERGAADPAVRLERRQPEHRDAHAAAGR